MDEIAAIEKPGNYSFCVVRGNSIRKTFTIRDESGERVSLTGLSGTALVTDTPDGSTLLTFSVAVDQSLADQATAGDVIVSAAGDDNNTEINGVWELVIHDGTPTGVLRKTVVSGAFSNFPQ